jgi:hypothetical protein
MISVVTVVNIFMLLDFHILNATTSLWTRHWRRFIIQRWRLLQPDHQCVKTTNQSLGRGQEVGAGGYQVSVLLESLIHSPFLFWYRKTPTTAATTTATTATPVRMKARM